MARANTDPEDLRPYSPTPQLTAVPDLDAYDPDQSWMPYSPDEHQANLFAEPARFVIGGRVLYRHNHHEDVTDAVVMNAEDDHPTKAIFNGLLVDLPPWPTLTLDTMYGPVRTREARARGSAGWLPLSVFEVDV